MARTYPKFLFSNPANTKTQGPFIVHLLFPKFVANYIGQGSWQISILENNVNKSVFDINILAVQEWYRKAYHEESSIYPFINVL